MEISIKGTPDDDLKLFNAGQKEEVQLEKTEERTAAIAGAQKENLQEQETETSNPLVASLKKFWNKIKPHTATVKKAKEEKAALRKLIAPDKLKSGAEEFSRKNPQFQVTKLMDLADKIKNLPKEKILELLRKEYPDPMDASYALAFLSSVFESDADKRDVQSIQEILNKDIVEKPKEERAKKLEAEAKTLATKESNEQALKMLKGGDLNNYLENLITYQGDAPAIGLMLSNSYKEEDMKKITYNLLSRLGRKIDKIRNIHHDPENCAELKAIMPLVRKLQSLLVLVKFFEDRNRPAKAAKVPKQKEAKTAKAA